MAATQQPHQYLVLVVGMLAGPEAGEQLYRQSQRQPSRFSFVVPAMKPSFGLTWTEEQAADDARERLEMMLGFATDLGMDVEGYVYTIADPVDAVRKLATTAEPAYDELIVIDHPKGTDRWLASSGLRRLETDPGLPITRLHAHPYMEQGKRFDRDEYRRQFEESRRQIRGE
ncbi:hypothetical protein BH23ACT10_BH23ACT10_24310 [soil metagenome]